MAEAKSSGGEQVWNAKKLRETWQQIQESHEFSSRLGQTIEFEQPEFIRQRHRMDMTEIDLEKILNPTCISPELIQFMVNAVDYISEAKTFVSKTPLNKLARTTIPELILGESAEGAYILARSLESWHGKHVAWNTVIEDHRGHVIDLSLYNFPSDELFLPGEVIIIKEPYLRLPRDKIPVIYSDCPTNIIVLRPFHSLFRMGKEIEWKNDVEENKELSSLFLRPLNASEWKKIGDSFFINTNNMVTARDAFHLGIDACLKEQNNSMSKKLQLYILATQLRLEYFEWVVEHAETFLQQFPEEKAAYLRLGTAYYGLRKYEEAMKTYENYCEKFPGEEKGQKELERARKRVRESQGEFDFEKLRKMSIESPIEELDCADYSGFVEMVKISGKGRGLVSTKDLKKGEVVMVSKALAAILDDRYIQTEDYMTVRNKLEIVGKLSRMIVKNPNRFGPLIYDLYANEKAVAAPVFCDPDLKTEPISDVGLIENIYKCNYFTIIKNSDEEHKLNGNGLFLSPSYFNHSCVPNLDCSEFYNDIMVIRAAKYIKKGTELTVPYVPPENSFDERQQKLRKRGFTCRCYKCKARM